MHTTEPTSVTANPRAASERGQTMVLMLLALSTFLIGALAFAVDIANLWFHRQMAQNAADAACTAGVMDMLQNQIAGTSLGGFTAGTNFSCSGTGASSYALCKYAAMNGYSGVGLTAGTESNDVNVTFPSSVGGIPTSCAGTPPKSVCGAGSVSAHPYIQVNVVDRARTYFMGLLNGQGTMDVGASATCGVLFSSSPIPLLVLDPRNESSVDNNGNFTIQIVGGPQRSIQVNSVSSTAVNINGASGGFNLSLGGPNGTGSDFGVTGTEGATNYNGGTTGSWLDPAGAISDPFASMAAPVNTGMPTWGQSGYTTVGSGVNGCIDPGGCNEYKTGIYSSGILVKNNSAIFDPGIYYMQGDLTADSNSCMRPSTLAGDGSGGTMFYFSGTSKVNVSANSGKNTAAGGNCGTSVVPLSLVKCISSGTGATTIPTTLNNLYTGGSGLIGNVLLGPCQTPTVSAQCYSNCSTNYGDPLGTNDPIGEQRGMLFFQDRSSTTGVQPSWSGGGSFGLYGIMYFHQCLSATAGAGTGCSTSTAFNDQFQLGGGSCSSTFVIGDIITDKLHLFGNPCIEMDLNPNALYFTLKASLVK